MPLVLHGGSGLRDVDFTDAISAGISVVHISTEIRVAFVEGLKESILKNKDEIVPYKILELAKEDVEEIVGERLKLFNNLK